MKTSSKPPHIMSIPSNGEWPIFEVLLNPRQLNLGSSKVKVRKIVNWSNDGGLLPARPVLAELPRLPAAHKQHTTPPSYLAFCQQPGSPTTLYHPGVVQEIGENGTLVFHYELSNVELGPCAVFVVAVLNTRLPPPPIDYFRRFNKL